MIGTADVHDFPRLEEQIGENPARFLRRTSREQVALAVIRGIETGERARAWRAVERRLAGVHDREPRSKILNALERAEEQARFETVAERREWLESVEIDDVQEPADDEEEPVLWRHTKEGCQSLDVEQESSMAWYCRACEQRTNRVEKVDPDDVSLDELPDALESIGAARRQEGSA